MRPNDTLFRIAQRHRTPMQVILGANVICNPRIVVSGDLLQIPGPEKKHSRLGLGPYYILLPGDNLECIAYYSKTTVVDLLRNNSVASRHHLYPGAELLIWGRRSDLDGLFMAWSGYPAGSQVSETQRGSFYQECFGWQAWGNKAVPFLIKLLSHNCPEVRYYAMLSLGRLGIDRGALGALAGGLQDSHHDNRILARLAADRIILCQQGYRRTRLLIKADRLLDDLNRPIPAVTPLVEGTGVIVLKWHIPGPERVDDHDIPMIYDYVLIAASSQRGFLPRHHGRLNLV